MKQTAVEWFAERIQSDKIFNFENVLKQAKEMDKEQKISFYVKAFTSFLSEESSEPYHEVIAEHGKEQAEQYYNKTFKNK